MPSILESQNVDLRDLHPVSNPPGGDQGTNKTDDTSNQSPVMLSSMPLMAATADLFTRQFYGGTRVPQQRILPPRRQAL